MKKNKYLPPKFSATLVMMECTIANGSGVSLHSQTITISEQNPLIDGYKQMPGWEGGLSESYEIDI